MTHHGWVPVVGADAFTPQALVSPFGRLFSPHAHEYTSYCLSLLAGALGPMQEAEPAPAQPEAQTNPAGFTFLGQFIDHDLTEFRVVGQDYAVMQQNPTISQRQRVLEDTPLAPEGLRSMTTTNGRTGRLDLDSVYGLLGTPQADLFDEHGMFRIVDTPNGPDLHRGPQHANGRLVADPRNDENKLVVQIHLLFEHLHNQLHAAHAGASPEQAGPTGPLFRQTRDAVVGAYQRIVLHDYLPRIVQGGHIDAVLAALADRTTCYQRMNSRCRAALTGLGMPDDVVAATVAMPVEFSHAVFRLGHSQLRDGYLLRTGAGARLFATETEPHDLRGNSPGSDGFDFHVDWKHFFRRTSTPPQHGRRIDGLLPRSVFRLPPPSIGEPPVSLAERNLRRGVDFGLPTGQEAAAELAAVYGYVPQVGSDVLFPAPVFGSRPEVLDLAANLQWQTPLWYYVLKESEAFGGGPQLGAVGGLVVAETIIGSIVESRLQAAAAAPGPGGFDREAETVAIVAEIQAERAALSPDGKDRASGPLRYTAPAPASVEEVRTMSQLVRFVV
ncbi:peroxidase family protein [Cellulomonas sp. PhB143]|uniref:peroxidase family protein n=1 Tax=Cellulomonas sp. PhB143 TaxID=2485186 RepID=UPI000F467F57|nr:peroxidase family protein [Cellulomonas sp. PhB143]ROS79126.1 heme peroxidase [Cellulomonas sp. PhB143]